MMKLLPFALVGLFAFVLSAAEGEKGDFKASEELPHAVVNTHELMEIFNEDLHHNLKEKMAAEPANARAWKLLKRQGYRAAEIANLVAMRNPGGKHGELWKKLSIEAQQVGVDLAEAAKKQDWEGAQASYQAIIKNCNACHQQIEPEHAPTIKP